MPLYTKPPKELLIDLIKESNPSLPLPLIASKLTFSTPKAITPIPGSNVNTEITITARGGSGYVKKVTVKYRRISLATLFRGLNAEVFKYTAANANSYPFDLYGLLSTVNNRFGLNLTQDDVTNTWFPIKDDKYYPDKRSSQAKIKAKPTSLIFVGETFLRWVSDLRSIGDMIKATELSVRNFPGNVSKVTNTTRYVLNCATFDADFRELCPNIDHEYNLQALGSNFSLAVPIQRELLEGINTVTGENYTYTHVNTSEPFAIGGIVPKLYTIPNAAVPEANSADFNRVLVIEYPNESTWGAGKLFLHYNA